MQQGPFQQVFVAEQRLGQAVAVLRIHIDLNAKQLLLVVPLVEGFALVQPLVALQAHQIPAQRGSHHLGDLGFADARRALNEQGPSQLQGNIQNRRKGFVVDIVAVVHFGFQFFVGHSDALLFSQYTIFRPFA